jgi:hypothetical protein
MQLSIDIGGTKTAFGILELVNTTPELKYGSKIKTVRGIDGIKRGLASIISNCEEWANLHLRTLNSTIFVGTAGNLSGENKSIVLPGSAVHLGTTPTEFDNCDLEALFTSACNNKYTFIIKNDGVAQLAGGLNSAFKSNSVRNSLLGEKVAYIGPGTGLGGAFAEIGFDGQTDFFTDGHIFDMEIKNSKGALVGAESVYSGTGFHTNNNVTTLSLNDSPKQFQKHKTAIEDMGYYLAQICIAIHKGHFKKLSKYSWSAKDYSQVKGIKHFFMGGSVGVSGPVSDLILNIAKSQIKKQGLHFTFYKIDSPIKAALLGAYAFL